MPVIDMYDKIYKGTFLGGNLTTGLRNKTKNENGGAVIWGGIRDTEQMKKVEETQVYYRGIDPTPIRDFIMTGYNTATRIGNAICLPGDVVFGAGGGVLFIPSHLVEEVVGGAAKTQVKDLFGFDTIGSVQETKPHPDMLVYSSSKAAQTNMMQSLSLQLASYGITVNNMAPGVIYTDRNIEALSNPEYAKEVTSSIPVGFYGTPDDCTGIISLLCSEQGRYITGQNIFVDGGKSVQ